MHPGEVHERKTTHSRQDDSGGVEDVNKENRPDEDERDLRREQQL